MSNTTSTTLQHLGIDFAPVRDVIGSGLISRTGLYRAIKQDKLTLYKLGNRSYLNRQQLNAAFIKK